MVIQCNKWCDRAYDGHLQSTTQSFLLSLWQQSHFFVLVHIFICDSTFFSTDFSGAMLPTRVRGSDPTLNQSSHFIPFWLSDWWPNHLVNTWPKPIQSDWILGLLNGMLGNEPGLGVAGSHLAVRRREPTWECNYIEKHREKHSPSHIIWIMNWAASKVTLDVFSWRFQILNKSFFGLCLEKC